MRAQIKSDTLESFASLRRDDRLVEFDLTEFTGIGKQNLNANQYFINKNIPR